MHATSLEDVKGNSFGIAHQSSDIGVLPFGFLTVNT